VKVEGGAEEGEAEVEKKAGGAKKGKKAGGTSAIAKLA